MKTNDILKQWKKQKLDKSVPDDFSQRVMEKIEAQTQNVPLISSNFFENTSSKVVKYIQAVAAIGMSAIGLYRATYQMIMILTP